MVLKVSVGERRAHLVFVGMLVETDNRLSVAEALPTHERGIFKRGSVICQTTDDTDSKDKLRGLVSMGGPIST